ncbi:uncharacterized protein RHOBADRAFT_55043 [Rhodotorula graminis WP1]|uniref:Pru domain-containing protein n=1 Tax=Rhodotorula graminis (strain WP1) TaxID=578459 RepID=A0A0N8PZU2_RHOGW|nr:uncharacterized protein RHOBADRAFT_55043 [Rhodotorula graminis WP1]KPV73277.1 hypothetical protein RHOBADRAFT_55043 [Rhodotorula graminis WP1]
MSAPLFQFQAGRAERQGDSNTVVPQPGRGLVYLQEEDGLLHFYYKDLESECAPLSPLLPCAPLAHLQPPAFNSSIVDDLIIFPGDATFDQATPDRVHVLKFLSSSARHFYWAQKRDLSHDEFTSQRRRVNELIGAEPAGDGDEHGAMDVEASASTDDVFMSSAAPSSSSAAPAPARAPATTSTSTATATSGDAALGNSAQLAQLQSILANLGGGGGGGVGGASVGGVPAFTLPDRASLARALRSPEYRRALASLDRALRTGATGPLVVGALGLGERAARGTEEFLDEVRRVAEEEREREREGAAGGGAGQGEGEGEDKGPAA